MNVLFLCNLIPAKIGGFEAFIEGMGRHCRDHGDALYIVFAGEPIEEVAERFRAAGIAWDVCPGWSELDGTTRPWRIIGAAMRSIRRRRADVVAVHFGNELPTLALILVTRVFCRRRLAWVWHQQQLIRDPRNVFHRNISRIRLLSTVCDSLVAPYEGGRRSFLRRGVPEPKTRMIYNGMPAFRSARSPGWLQEELGIPRDSVLVSNINTLIPRKRVDVTLKAFAKATTGDAAPGETAAHLLVVGTGSEESALRQLAAELSIASRVHFLGRRNDVDEVEEASDVFTLSSDAEACPLVVLTAASVGTPCVVTDVGAAHELVDDGKTGFVTPPGDVDAFAARLRDLLDNRDLRLKLGRGALDLWQRRFRRADMVSSYHALYQQVGNISD